MRAGLVGRRQQQEEQPGRLTVHRAEFDAGGGDAYSYSQLARGERLVEILKQPQYRPLPSEKQVITIFAANNGYLDEYPVSALARYESELYTFFDSRKSDILNGIREKKAINDDLRGKITAALDEFKKEFTV